MQPCGARKRRAIQFRERRHERKTQRDHCRRRHRRPVRGQCADCQGLKVTVYEQAPHLARSAPASIVTPNSGAPSRTRRHGPAVEKYGARVGGGSHYLRDDGPPIAPVQVTDSSGWNAVFGMHRADFVDFLSAGLPAGVVNTGHRAPASHRTATSPASHSPTAHRRSRRRHRRRRHPFRTAAVCIPAFQAGVPRHRLPIAGSFRTSACRNGRPTSGKCGLGKGKHFSFSRCAPARSSTSSASSRPMRR